MDISAELLDEIVAHARAEAPNECCGVVSAAPSSDGAVALSSDSAVARAVRVHRARNTAASPLRFEIDGLEVMGLLDSIEGDGLQIGAIYHSHTRTAPYPSQTDINFAVNWPGVEWIIVGLTDPSAPEIRSYLIEEGTVREVEIAQVAV